MKVIYSVGASVPGGGIGNLASHALRAIAKNNIELHAYLAGFKGDYLNSKQLTLYPWLNRIPWYSLKDNLFDILVARGVDSADIFHGWNNFSLLSLRAAKKKGAKIVIERASSHILTQERLLADELQKFGIQTKPINPYTVKKSVQEYKEADFVMVPEGFAYQSFIDQGYPQEKLISVQFGVDIAKFKVRERQDDGIFRAIFVGQVGLRKGVQYLLKAWEELNLEKSELLVIGPVAPEFKSIIKKYDLSKVTMINYSNDLSEFYAKSDVFIFPSIEEGSALVTFEAMASGLPVITTSNAGSLVEDGKNGVLVQVSDTESLKQAILNLYNNRYLLTKYSLSGRQKVEGYSWERYEESLIKNYSEIVMRVSKG